MRINNIITNNDNSAVEKFYQPEEEFKCSAEKSFKHAVEELLGVD